MTRTVAGPGLFGGVFAHGGADMGDKAWLTAMPHKRNPVAAVAILGCTRQVPGLLATLAAHRTAALAHPRDG